MIAYKAFSKGLVCRGYRFGPGVNVTDKANCRANGFHCAENPIDCLTYYPNWDASEYWQVEAEGDIDEDGDDSKISCTRIELVKKLSFEDFVLAAAKYLITHPTRYKGESGKVSVCRDKGKAEKEGTAVIVKGLDPAAYGKDGSILVLIREDDQGRITQAKWIKAKTPGTYRLTPEGVARE